MTDELWDDADGRMTFWQMVAITAVFCIPWWIGASVLVYWAVQLL